jgi:hypothetical protein
MRLRLGLRAVFVGFCMVVFSVVVVPFSAPVHAATFHALKPGDTTYPTAQYINGNCGGDDVWHTYSDQQGYGEYWTPTTGSENCTSAVWTLNGYYTDYKYNIWVPSNYANASIGIGFYSGSTRVAVCSIYEELYTDQWAPITGCSNLTNISKVELSSNNAEIGLYLGFGYPNHSLQLVA